MKARSPAATTCVVLLFVLALGVWDPAKLLLNIATVNLLHEATSSPAGSGAPRSRSAIPCDQLSALSSSQLDALEADFRRVGDWSRGSERAVWRLAELDCARGRFAAAEGEFALAQDRTGSRTLPTLERGWNEAMRGEIDRAVEMWRHVPGIAGLITDYAVQNLAQGNRVKAIQLARLAVAVNDTCTRALLTLAQSQERADELDGALQSYALAESSLHVSPTSQGCETEPSEVLIAYGNALAVRGQFEAAISKFQEATQLAPDDPRPHALLADALWQGRSDSSAASAAYMRSAELDPRFVWGYIGLSNLFLALGQPERAEPWIGKVQAFAGSAEREWPFILQGRVYVEKRMYPEALQSLSEAIRIAPSNGWSYFVMGVILQAQSDSYGALASYNRAASLLPGNIGVLRAKSDLLAKLGQIPEERR